MTMGTIIACSDSMRDALFRSHSIDASEVRGRHRYQDSGLVSTKGLELASKSPRGRTCQSASCKLSLK